MLYNKSKKNKVLNNNNNNINNNNKSLSNICELIYFKFISATYFLVYLFFYIIYKNLNALKTENWLGSKSNKKSKKKVKKKPNKNNFDLILT